MAVADRVTELRLPSQAPQPSRAALRQRRYRARKREKAAAAAPVGVTPSVASTTTRYGAGTACAA
jgi:hypothetical protein